MPLQNYTNMVEIHPNSSKYMGQLWHGLQSMSEARLYKNTGCRATCERREWKTTLVYDWNLPMDTNSSQLQLTFFFSNGMYQVKKEYYKYTFDNLMADFGGLVGLFLGQSILSFFDLACSIFTKVTYICRLNLRRIE